MKPLDDKINDKILPSLLQAIITEKDRKLYSLPLRLGGLAIPILSETATEHYNASQRITAPLVSLMILQENSLPDEKEVNDIKLAVKKEKEQLITIKAENIEKDLSPEKIRAISEAKEKGASSWHNVIPLQEYGFVLK